ncbi:MAG TPA: MFS transporter [Schlesneria sp.]|jgi:MFS family permease
MATDNAVSIEAPSRIRWLMFCLACGTSWFLYLHRYAWNIILPKLQEAHELNNTEGGFITSLFYWTYAGGQIPSGVVIDLFGPHLFLGTSIVLWSIALIGFAVISSLYGVAGMRLVFGAAQAGGYPGLTKVTRVWFPLRTRTTVQGWVATTFGRAGGAMSPIILGTVLMGWCGLSWQVALGVMGLVGVIFGVAFLCLYRNSPADHPQVNDAERELIAEGGIVQSLRGTLPWSKAARSRSLLCFMVQQFLDAGSDLVFATLIGSYFLYRHNLDMKNVGWLSSLPLWGGALGGIAGGWLNDRLIRTTGSRRWSRSGIGFVGKIIGCVMLYIVSEQEGATAASIALMLAKFFSDWSQPTVWGTCTDLGGRCSATVFSIINTAGTIGGIVMPLVFGWVLDLNTTKTLVDGAYVKTMDWGPLFLLVAAMYLASGIFWLLIDCTKSLDSDH